MTTPTNRQCSRNDKTEKSTNLNIVNLLISHLLIVNLLIVNLLIVNLLLNYSKLFLLYIIHLKLEIINNFVLFIKYIFYKQ